MHSWDWWHDGSPLQVYRSIMRVLISVLRGSQWAAGTHTDTTSIASGSTSLTSNLEIISSRSVWKYTCIYENVTSEKFRQKNSRRDLKTTVWSVTTDRDCNRNIRRNRGLNLYESCSEVMKVLRSSYSLKGMEIQVTRSYKIIFISNSKRGCKQFELIWSIFSLLLIS